MVRRSDRKREPWDDDFWPKRWGFDSLFPSWDEIDEEFERMRRYMDSLFEAALKSGAFEEGKPFVYGFTMRVGPDGRPQIEEFGNTRPMLRTSEGGCLREPIVDINEGPETISVTAELPGVEKEDVDLVLQDDVLIIDAKGPQCRYYKEVQLPAPVKEEGVKATCKNGILDVTLPRLKKEVPRGKRIKIE